MAEHLYRTALDWSGSTGGGYRRYDRTHAVTLGEATTLRLSADPAFRGDADLPNPEQLLLAAASSCQLLSFLAVAARAGVDVVSYADAAHAVMPEDASPVRITRIDLDLRVTVRGADEPTVLRLLQEAHEQCYIANSISAEVTVSAQVDVVP